MRLRWWERVGEKKGNSEGIKGDEKNKKRGRREEGKVEEEKERKDLCNERRKKGERGKRSLL